MGSFKTASQRSFGDDSGQSTVEYLIVTFALVAALFVPTSLYETISDTLKNKYRSYCFSVAVSDPPRKQFDDRVAKGAEVVHEVIGTIEEIENMANKMEHFQLPFDEVHLLPSIDDIHVKDIVEKELEPYIKK